MKTIDVKVDHIGFNGSHWSGKSEQDFITDCDKTGNYPAGLTGEDKIKWMKDAYAKICATVKEVEESAKKKEAGKPQPAAKPNA
jgi:hypothetical protein